MRQFFAALLLMHFALSPLSARDRWTAEKAQEWWKNRGWVSGANYLPNNAINQLEMWQAETFDPATIDRELGWAQDLGFNSMRVFLHHLPHEQDPAGFLERVDKFLVIAAKHKIGVLFVLFDSCWDPNPVLGKQRDPKPGVHNSGWVQSPGARDLIDSKRHTVLEKYTRDVIGRFKNDPRVDGWDVWNEPDNQNDNSYGKNWLKQEPARKVDRTLELLAKSMRWTQECDPTQPITSGVWIGQWPEDGKLSPTERVQIDHSDVISYHSYDPLDRSRKCVDNLRRYNRPILCTEYMARPQGSNFDPMLGYMKEQGVGAYNWGFIEGKSQTNYPWDSWQKPYKAEPPVWFHDILHTDGKPYRQAEVEYIRKVTGAGK
jgi:hypothetical protein